jgi:hypothetical protein
LFKCERCGFEGDSSQIKKSPTSFPEWYGKPICKKCYVELKEKTLGGKGEVESKNWETKGFTEPVSYKGSYDIDRKVKWGWMGFFIAVLVVLSPLFTLFMMFTNWSYILASDIFDSYPGLFFIAIFDVFIVFSLMLFGIYVGLSIYRLKERALYKAKIFLILSLIYGILSPFLFFLAGLPDYLLSVIGYAIVPSIIRSLFTFGIWYWFVSSSKTVIRIVEQVPHIY